MFSRSSNAQLIVLTSFLTFLSAGCGLGVGPKSEERRRAKLDLSKVTAISVKGDDGDVTISPSVDGTGSVEFVERTSRYFSGTGHCHASQSIDGTTLYVEVKKDFNAGCDTDTNIVAPPAALIDVKVDNGNVRVIDFQNTINVAGDNGNIDVTFANPGGDAAACNGTFSTDNGNLDVNVAFQPAAGALSLKSDNGAAKVGLPGGTPYSLDSQVDNGSLKKDFEPAGNGAFKIAMKTDNGSLKVYKN